MKPGRAPLIAGLVVVACLIGVLCKRQQSGKSGAPPVNPSTRQADKPASRKKEEAGQPLHQPRLNEADMRLVKSDPAKAIAAAPDHLDLLVAWASLDPEAAMAWVKRNGGGSGIAYSHLLGAVAAGILIKDGVDAMNRFVAEHQDDEAIPPKNQGQLLQYVFFTLGRADTIDAALGILRATPQPDLAGMMVLGTEGARQQIRAIDYLEAKGVKVAVEYWAFQESITADPRYWADWAEQRDSGLLAEIIQSWARGKPDEARAWIDQRIPAGDARREEIERLLAP